MCRPFTKAVANRQITRPSHMPASSRRITTIMRNYPSSSSFRNCSVTHTHLRIFFSLHLLSVLPSSMPFHPPSPLLTRLLILIPATRQPLNLTTHPLGSARQRPLAALTHAPVPLARKKHSLIQPLIITSLFFFFVGGWQTRCCLTWIDNNNARCGVRASISALCIFAQAYQ